MQPTMQHVDVESDAPCHPEDSTTSAQPLVRRRLVVTALVLVTVIAAGLAGATLGKPTETADPMPTHLAVAAHAEKELDPALDRSDMRRQRFSFAPYPFLPNLPRRDVEATNRRAQRPAAASHSWQRDWHRSSLQASQKAIKMSLAQQDTGSTEGMTELRPTMLGAKDEGRDARLQAQPSQPAFEDISESYVLVKTPSESERAFMQKWNLNQDSLATFMKASPSVRTKAMHTFDPCPSSGPACEVNLNGKFICFIAMLVQRERRGFEEAGRSTPDAGWKKSRARDWQLRRYMAELWAKSGSERSKRGEGPLLPAIRRERVDKARPSLAEFKEQGRQTYISQGYQLLTSLEEWQEKRAEVESFEIKKADAGSTVVGESSSSQNDKDIAQGAIEDLEVALGVVAEQVLAAVDKQTVVSYSTIGGRLGSMPLMDRGASSRVVLPGSQRVPYLVRYDNSIHKVAITHGSEQMFTHTECRHRMRVIKRQVHEQKKKGLPRAAEVFVDAVVLDLEQERTKHDGLSRGVLITWANALSSAHLKVLEMAQFDKSTESIWGRTPEERERRHKFEANTWLAVARVLNGVRQEVMRDDEI